MRSFRKGNVAKSVEEFGEALRLDPASRPYLWQRGLSLFYAGAAAVVLPVSEAMPRSDGGRISHQACKQFQR